MPEQGRMASRESALAISGVRGCERCADLEEQVAYLRSELGFQADNEAYRKLRSYLVYRQSRVGRASAVRVVLALYGAKGRTLTRDQLLDAVPPRSGEEDERQLKTIDVWVCFARRALGKAAIESVWGRGYRLTEAGMAAVAGIMDGSITAKAA